MSKKTKKIIVNSLTLSRILGAFILPFIFLSVNTTFLIILLAVLLVTDFFDGKLSRMWGVSTIGGSLLDPLGDKLLAIACMLGLIGTNVDYLVLLVLEVMIGILNVYRMFRGENVKSNMKGKVKTWFLSIAMVVGTVYLFRPTLIGDLLGIVGMSTDRFVVTENTVVVFLVMAGIAEVFTLVSYVREALKSKESFKKFVELKSFKEIFVRLFDEEMYKEDKDRPLLDIIKKEG